MLRITGPAVLSVEGSIARLRRAALRPALAAQSAEVLPYGTNVAPQRQHFGERRRAAVPTAGAGAPRARRERPPLDRLRVLTDSSAAPQPGETIEVGPNRGGSAGSSRSLAGWGYLELDR